VNSITVNVHEVPELRILDTLRIEGHNFGFAADDYRILSNESIQTGAKDVLVEGSIAYIACGYLGIAILDCSRKDSLRLLSRAPTGGNATEIALSFPYLYVADRPAGIAVFDVSDPAEPKPAGYYDCVEFATGLDVQGKLMAVCNRPHGLEICDLTDPGKPKFLGEVLVGEAQGVRIRGRFAYAGIWRDSRIAVVDLADPAKPRHAADIPLDGYGWGCALCSDLLAVATGHHSANRGHGHGHGVELFRLGADGIPLPIFRINTSPFFRRTNDWWRVRFAGDLLLHADGLNGAFVYDCKDPENVRVLGRVESFDYAGGVAAVGDRLVVADMRNGVHLAEMAPRVARTSKAPAAAVQPAPPKSMDFSPNLVHASEGSIRRLALSGDVLIAASGAAGLEILDPAAQKLRRLASLVLPGPAVDLAVEGSTVWVALRGSGLAAVDIADPLHPRLIAQCSASPVHLMEIAGDWIVGVRGEGGVALFHKRGLRPVHTGACIPFFPTQLAAWRGGIIALAGFEAAHFAIGPDGAVHRSPIAVNDGNQDRILSGAQGVAVNEKRMVVWAPGRLSLLEGRDLNGALSELSVAYSDALRRGLIAWDGSWGVAGDPFSGTAMVFRTKENSIEIAGIQKLPGHPGRSLLLGDRALIPCGHAGIFALDAPNI
jgi:hypothetical protein